MIGKTAAAITIAVFFGGAFGCGTASAVNWDAIAQCESGGNWSINTGNGFSGGLQWAAGTWARWRAPDDPLFAWQASRDQQIAAAERLYAVAGTRPWPVCGRRG